MTNVANVNINVPWWGREACGLLGRGIYAGEMFGQAPAAHRRSHTGLYNSVFNDLFPPTSPHRYPSLPPPHLPISSPSPSILLRIALPASPPPYLHISLHTPSIDIPSSLLRGLDSPLLPLIASELIKNDPAKQKPRPSRLCRVPLICYKVMLQSTSLLLKTMFPFGYVILLEKYRPSRGKS